MRSEPRCANGAHLHMRLLRSSVKLRVAGLCAKLWVLVSAVQMEKSCLILVGQASSGTSGQDAELMDVAP